MFEHISCGMLPFFILYAVTGVVPLVAALYLLLRRGNAIAPEVTSPVRVRRWAAAFFGAAALGHVWWLLFYDYTRKDFTARYDPYHFVNQGMTTGAANLIDVTQMAYTGEYADGLGLEAREYKTRKHMNYVTLGLSFLVNF